MLERSAGLGVPNRANRKTCVEDWPLRVCVFLCEQHARKITRNLSIGFGGDTWQVTGHGKGYGLRDAAVTVCKGFDGSVTELGDGRELPVRLVAEGEEPPPEEDSKSVRNRVDRAKAKQQSRPAGKLRPDHPWRRGFQPGVDGVAAPADAARAAKPRQAANPDRRRLATNPNRRGWAPAQHSKGTSLNWRTGTSLNCFDTYAFSCWQCPAIPLHFGMCATKDCRYLNAP